MRINKEGYGIIGINTILCAAVILVSFLIGPYWLPWILVPVGLYHFFFVMWFFREPKRELLSDPDTVFSPADGTIVAIERIKENEFLHSECIQISVFMSIRNVHVNWFPVSGEILYYKYHPGKFLLAWHPKSSELNERTTTVVDAGGHRILFRQIAGFVARRIVSYAKVGENATQNTKCGFIKFGSRLDVMVPLDSEILVSLDDKVTGSQTPLARLR